MTEPTTMTFQDAIELATVRSGNGPVTALYPSAGSDTAPFSFLMKAFLQHRGIPMPTPDLYVYVDRERPVNPGEARLTFVDEGHPDTPLVVETLSVEPLEIEGGPPAGLLTVKVHSDVEEEVRTHQVLRILADNKTVYRLCREANWSPDVFIGVDDGCCGFGGNDGCENVLEPHVSPFRLLRRPPRFWVTDNFMPHPKGELRVGGRVRGAEQIGLEVTKLGLLSSRWGHRWQPLFGATAFSVREVAGPARREAAWAAVGCSLHNQPPDLKGRWF